MPNTEQSIEETGGVPVVEVEMEVSGMTQTAVDKTLSIADMAADAKATGDAIDQVAGDVADLAADVADIEQWTGEDIPLNSENNAPSVADAVATNAEDIADIKQWTGEDLPLNTQSSATIAEAFASIFANLYPVGSLYITAAEQLPSWISSAGTWVEVKIPITWGDMKNGTRSFVIPEEGETFNPGTLHFWLRTE